MLIAIVVFVPFFLIIACYIAIVCTLKASHKKLNTSPQRWVLDYCDTISNRLKLLILRSFVVLDTEDASSGSCERRRKEQGLTLLVSAI